MSSTLLDSQLYDEKTFYQTFLQDLEKCKNEVIIESPYITRERMRTFDRIFQKLLKRGVKIYIFTRDPKEHEEFMEPQSEEAIRWCEIMGIQVLLCVGGLPPFGWFSLAPVPLTNCHLKYASWLACFEIIIHFLLHKFGNILDSMKEPNEI